MELKPFLFFLIFPHLVLAQQEELSVPGQNLFVNKINVVQSLDPSLNGAGITVSIKEFRFDSTDVDLRGRVLVSPQAAANLTTHANIIASLVGGAGNADLQGRGVAPGCNLVSSSFVGLQPDADYVSQNITVQNHAYGVNIQNWYGAGAVAYDQTTAENPYLLHVFSAGNKQDSASISGTYANLPGLANLSGNFKMAKNVLLVGAVDSLAQLDPFSSNGPAYDGRIKPDLVAFGLDGTSGAAALVSGSAAVIQQALRNITHDLPRSDLVRAVLINGADDIDTPGPDFKSGFGNLNLKKSVDIVYSEHFIPEKVSAGQTISIPLLIPPNHRQAKITLCWNDPTAALLAQKALLHDLNFTLLDPLGDEFLPWVLNTFPHPDSLRQAAHRGQDTLNNVEQITLDYPLAGLWEIRVAAPASLPQAQDFALAWNWDTLQSFAWTYPYENDPSPANTTVILRWETTLPDSFARLEWRPWPSPDWRLVNDAVSLQHSSLPWILPDTFAESQVRMVVGGRAFESFIFLISKELRMKVGFNCPDSIMLYWNPAHPSAQYQIYGLGIKELEPITIVTDTFVVLQKHLFLQPRFAVAPLATEKDALGPRSPAPDISTQGVECYFSDFLAELNGDFQVDLKLKIGTDYGLHQVFFEKMIGGNFVSINEQIVDKEAFEFVDVNPQAGANTYRPRLLLHNGASIVGDPSTVYYGGKDGWWIFPNPAPSRGFLSVISATDGDAVFSLFDVLGKSVLEQKLEDIRVQILLNGLSSGVYFYKINNQNLFLGEGKLIVK